MPENNQKDPAQPQTDTTKENTNEQDKPLHVHNPFTGEDVDITQEQLDSIEKSIEAQTERD